MGSRVERRRRTKKKLGTSAFLRARSEVAYEKTWGYDFIGGVSIVWV